MPTYDYECDGCGYRFEIFEPVNAKRTKPCPKCRVRRARRQIGIGAGFLFKGSGFYATDYKRQATGDKRNEKSEESAAKDRKKEESKKE